MFREGILSCKVRPVVIGQKVTDNIEECPTVSCGIHLLFSSAQPCPTPFCSVPSNRPLSSRSFSFRLEKYISWPITKSLSKIVMRSLPYGKQHDRLSSVIGQIVRVLSSPLCHRIMTAITKEYEWRVALAMTKEGNKYMSICTNISSKASVACTMGCHSWPFLWHGSINPQLAEKYDGLDLWWCWPFLWITGAWTS